MKGDKMTQQRYRHPLDNAPPTLSDLPPSERRQQLLARERQHREDWLRNRTPRPIRVRLAGLLRGDR